MAKSQSESALLLLSLLIRETKGVENPPPRIRGARGVTKLTQGIRRGEENDAWPGQKNNCFWSLRGTQRRSNPKKGSLK